MDTITCFLNYIYIVIHWNSFVMTVTCQVCVFVAFRNYIQLWYISVSFLSSNRDMGNIPGFGLTFTPIL